MPLSNDFETRFTALNDLSSRVRIDFSHTRANRATGEISYDVSVTNIGSDELAGPLMLLLDPGRYFSETIDGAASRAAATSPTSGCSTSALPCARWAARWPSVRRSPSRR
jgi:hypothetical protein